MGSGSGCIFACSYAVREIECCFVFTVGGGAVSLYR